VALSQNGQQNQAPNSRDRRCWPVDLGFIAVHRLQNFKGAKLKRTRNKDFIEAVRSANLDKIKAMLSSFDGPSRAKLCQDYAIDHRMRMERVCLFLCSRPN
jgi:hypothetical protein